MKAKAGDGETLPTNTNTLPGAHLLSGSGESVSPGVQVEESNPRIPGKVPSDPGVWASPLPTEALGRRMEMMDAWIGILEFPV